VNAAGEGRPGEEPLAVERAFREERAAVLASHPRFPRQDAAKRARAR